MPFIEYKPEQFSGRKSDLAITLSKPGTIYFSRMCYDSHLKSAASIKVFFDEKTNDVAFKPIPKSEEQGLYFSVTLTKTFRCTLAGRRLFQFFKFAPTKSTRFKATWDQDNGWLVINLKKPI